VLKNFRSRNSPQLFPLCALGADAGRWLEHTGADGDFNGDDQQDVEAARARSFRAMQTHPLMPDETGLFWTVSDPW
jgi:hypothetical protein